MGTAKQNIRGLETSEVPIIIPQLQVIQPIVQIVKQQGGKVVTKEVVKLTQYGQVSFINSKSMLISFDKSFDKPPLVSITMMSNSVLNPYTTNITKNNFTINFTNKWTGDISWVAIEK